MTSNELIQEIQSWCKVHADEAIVAKYARYFKEGYDGYGIPTDDFRAKIKELLASKSLTLETVVNASNGLISSSMFEEPSFAISLLKGFHKQWTPDTFKTIEHWFSMGIRNWAHTDAVCGELLGPMMIQGLVSMENFDLWRSSEFKFQRRAVPVALIKPMKKNPVMKPYLDFIDPMMLDNERVVHQGLGWFLREMWKIDPQPVEAFLVKWKEDAPRLIFQYATEKMTKEQRLLYRSTKPS
jgi:3-methyladenine DNA glycosylase AlkD